MNNKQAYSKQTLNTTKHTHKQTNNAMSNK